MTQEAGSTPAPRDGDPTGRTVVLKLGGSVITHKDQPETVDTERLAEVAAAIGNAKIPNLVVVHGGGSFGHPAAEAAGASIESGTRDSAVIREIHEAMGRLNETVLDALEAENVPAVPVRPFSVGHRNQDGQVLLPSDQISTMLAEGFVPVLHGDVFTSVGAGATIVSGDELVVALAAPLDADAIGLCTTVPGVLDETGAVIAEIPSYEAVNEVLEGSTSTDVTGGMAGKVRALLQLDASAQIFDESGLADFLAGNRPGTRIDGRNSG